MCVCSRLPRALRPVADASQQPSRDNMFAIPTKRLQCPCTLFSHYRRGVVYSLPPSRVLDSRQPFSLRLSNSGTSGLYCHALCSSPRVDNHDIPLSRRNGNTSSTDCERLHSRTWVSLQLHAANRRPTRLSFLTPRKTPSITSLI